MDFCIADTFTDSLARLTGDEQRSVKPPKPCSSWPLAADHGWRNPPLRLPILSTIPTPSVVSA